jgi:hypothetical protein
MSSATVSSPPGLHQYLYTHCGSCGFDILTSVPRDKGGRPPVDERATERRKRFGAEVKALRNGLSQAKFALKLANTTQAAGWTQEKISRIEDGLVPVTIELVEDVARAHAMSVGQLLGRVYAGPLGLSAAERQALLSNQLYLNTTALLIDHQNPETLEVLSHAADPDLKATLLMMTSLSEDDRAIVRLFTERLHEYRESSRGQSQIRARANRHKLQGGRKRAR